jgi:hypothetical protein
VKSLTAIRGYTSHQNHRIARVSIGISGLAYAMTIAVQIDWIFAEINACHLKAMIARIT